MADETLPTTWFAEAKDENTPATRLAELANYAPLQALVAANPATSASILRELSTASDPAIRRAVAQNPNASVAVLCALAAEFPEEFRRNPILSILHMINASFVKELPLLSWASLLRFADLSPAWFLPLQNDRTFRYKHPEIWELLHLHVSLIPNNASQQERSAPGDVRRAYQRALPKPVALPPQEDVELFVFFAMLFPYTTPMLKKQWVIATQISPNLAGRALALIREIGAKTPGRLAQGKHTFLLSQIAHHPATPPRVLQQLANYNRKEWTTTLPRPTVYYATASNPRTPQATIYQLLANGEDGLRRAAITHPTLDSSNDEVTALDQDATVRAALATLPRLTPALFAQLASDPALSVRAALARNLRVPLDILRKLSSDLEPAVRAAAASNPRLPLERQKTLFVDAIESVRASLSGNARLLPEHAALLAQDPSPRVRAQLAANPRVSIELLAPFLQAEEARVWRGLARHPHASPALLTQLARKDDPPTRTAVAAHTRTPSTILAELAREKTYAMRFALCANPNTPLDVLEQVLDTSSVELLHCFIKHPAMRHARQRPLLSRLVAQIQPLIAGNRLPDWLRRVFLQYYTTLPVEIVSLFVTSPYWQERYLVARRPHLPETILQTLAQDGICYVQNAARAALEQRQRIPSASWQDSQQ